MWHQVLFYVELHGVKVRRRKLLGEVLVTLHHLFFSLSFCVKDNVTISSARGTYVSRPGHSGVLVYCPNFTTRLFSFIKCVMVMMMSVFSSLNVAAGLPYFRSPCGQG